MGKHEEHRRGDDMRLDDLQREALVEEIIERTLDMIPPGMDGAEAGSYLIVAAMGVAARALVLCVEASDAKEFTEKVQAFLSTRDPRIEVLLMKLTLELWENVQERRLPKSPPTRTNTIS
jgi:hypothetical protein